MQHRVRGMRASLDHARAGSSQRLVLMYRRVKLFDAAGPQQFRQRYRILDCKVGALAVVRKHSVRGIAHQYDAATLPGPQWPYFE